MRTEQFPIRPVLEHFGFELTDRYGPVRCKFHGDRSPSATWSEYYFKCFACDAHGDAVRLLHEQEGLEWDEAYDRAKDLTGVRDGEVREEPRRSGGLSFEQRIHQGNRRFVPPRRGPRPSAGR